jgi:hypothetical protein
MHWIVCADHEHKRVKNLTVIGAGIYAIGDIRFRQRFLSKCHLPAKHTDEPAYAVRSTLNIYFTIELISLL